MDGVLCPFHTVLPCHCRMSQGPGYSQHQRDSPSYGQSILHPILSSLGHLHSNDDRPALSLNLLLLGDRQSGRSSVGNALIGAQVFQTGISCSQVPVTNDYKRVSRTFPKFFRRQGAESDLTLTVCDTPPVTLHPARRSNLCLDHVHVLVLVVRADLPRGTIDLEQYAQDLFGVEWHRHAVLVLTHADQLEREGLSPSLYVKQSSDWLGTLARRVEGGVYFLDNSCDWPGIQGRPLRDLVLRLSATNHHSALNMRSEDEVS